MFYKCTWFQKLKIFFLPRTGESFPESAIISTCFNNKVLVLVVPVRLFIGSWITIRKDVDEDHHGGITSATSFVSVARLASYRYVWPSVVQKKSRWKTLIQIKLAILSGPFCYKELSDHNGWFWPRTMQERCLVHDFSWINRKIVV